MRKHKDVQQGTLALMVLKTLGVLGPPHGFGLARRIEQISGHLLSASFAQTRQAAVLTGVFGALALLLSGIGVYGVAAVAVSRPTRDIGIRMALGAGAGDIVRTIGGRGTTVIAAGLALVCLGALAFTRLAGSMLFGVSAGDAATFAEMAALLGAVSLVAFSIPVRAATRLDALAAIRRE